MNATGVADAVVTVYCRHSRLAGTCDECGLFPSSTIFTIPIPNVYAVEVQELRADRDRLLVENGTLRLDLERAVKWQKRTISNMRRCLAEARGELSATSKRRPPR